MHIFILVFIVFSVSFLNATEKIIVIDVSHGGKDSGVEIDGFREKDLAFEIALKIQALNKSDNLKILLTRDGDYFLSLDERVEFINSVNPDYVISLHINSSPDSSHNGFELFISPGNESSALAKRIESSLSSQFLGNGITASNFYILRNTKVPAATLEFGYLSNPEDRALLTTESGQKKIAKAIYNILN